MKVSNPTPGPYPEVPSRDQGGHRGPTRYIRRVPEIQRGGGYRVYNKEVEDDGVGRDKSFDEDGAEGGWIQTLVEGC